MRLRTRILLFTFGLASAVVIPTGILSWKFLSAALEERSKEALRKESALLLFLMESPWNPPGADAGAPLRTMASVLGRELAVVSADGNVMYASDSSLIGDPVVEWVYAGTLRNRESAEGIRTGVEGAEVLVVARRIPENMAPPLGGAVLVIGMSAEPLRREERSLLVMLVAIWAALVGLVTAVAMPLSGSMLKKLAHIGHTARMIAGGALAERAVVTGRDELGELAGSLNEMAEKLNRDIEKLQKLERVRSEFLGNVSHELRTPIFAIQGFVETLLDGAIDDPAVNREFLEKALRHTQRLNALLRDLIEISRIESGEMKMSFRYLPVGPLLRQALEDLRPEAEKKRMTLVIAEGADETLEVYADRDRLRQAVVNLIDNAVKYTDPGGRVVLGAVRKGSFAEISVTDTGCGIAAEHIPRLFERFYRVDRDRSREVGGTGLGLAIVKHIVEAHGGTLGVESVVGEGSTFSFTLKV